MSIITLPLPNQLADGQIGDAVPLMADLNYIANQVNANAQPLAAGPVLAQWQYLGVNGTFISTTSFSVTGNYTAILTAGQKLQTINTGGTVYSYVNSTSFGSGITTVNVVNLLGAVLDVGLSVINVGILGNNPFTSAIPQKSIIQILWGHNTDTIASGTSQIVCTNNGFSLIAANYGDGGIFPLATEFNTTTGVFSPTRFGYYLISQYVQVNTTGVTFSGACSIGVSSAGVLASPANPDFCASLQANRACAVNAYVDYFSVATENLGFKMTFSAGTPLFVQGTLTIIGPL